MVLVDTSVWIDHLRHDNARLRQLLLNGLVVTHPFVIGELACGNIKNRLAFLESFRQVPLARLSEHDEVLHLLDHHRLMGAGLGWLDMHLLASAKLSHAKLWTLDSALRKAAGALHIAL